MQVLFVGKGKDCRALLAEAIFNHVSRAGCKAGRASCDTPGPPAREALELLRGQGIAAGDSPPDALPLSSLPHAATGDAPMLVVSVCESRCEGPCPYCDSSALRAHWPVHDPLQRHLLPHDPTSELLDLYHILRARIERSMPLLEGSRAGDPERLQRELDRIGHFLP